MFLIQQYAIKPFKCHNKKKRKLTNSLLTKQSKNMIFHTFDETIRPQIEELLSLGKSAGADLVEICLEKQKYDNKRDSKMKSLEVNTRKTKLFFLVLRFNFGKLELYCFQRKLRYDNLVSAIVLRPKLYCEQLSTYKSGLIFRYIFWLNIC